MAHFNGVYRSTVEGRVQGKLSLTVDSNLERPLVVDGDFLL
jgi:hypothetical protein